MLTTTDVGNVTQARGFPDHQMIPIGDAQHFQAFGPWLCFVFSGWCGVPTATALRRGHSSITLADRM